MGSTPFSIRIDETLKARLEQVAVAEERSLSYVAQKAIADFLDERDFKKQEIARAYAEAEQGAFVSDDAVTAWVDSWGMADELPRPAADILQPKRS